MMKICLLGASGSIGTQTIDVMLKNPKDFDLVAFSIGCQTRKITPIIKKFPNIKIICLKNKKDARRYQNKYANIKFYFGDDGLINCIKESNANMVVNALVGFVGLLPTLEALKEDKILCLANKEALVVGGELVNKLLNEGHGKLFPIDSEHAALHKCLAVDDKNVEKLIITASGGAFRHLNREQLESVTPEDALKHPTWKMGNKITIDCASMVNKTFEVIEAYHLFHYPFNQIDILINYESYVHSLVKYNNGYRLDAGKPDMRVPIKYALYQGLTNFNTVFVKKLEDFKETTFHQFDEKRYPIIRYAKLVMDKKGTYGAVLNASNEVAVHAFLNHQIPFLAIERIIEICMKEHKNTLHPDYNKLLEIDLKTRQKANEIIAKGEY